MNDKFSKPLTCLLYQNQVLWQLDSFSSLPHICLVCSQVKGTSVNLGSLCSDDLLYILWNGWYLDKCTQSHRNVDVQKNFADLISVWKNTRISLSFRPYHWLPSLHQHISQHCLKQTFKIVLSACKKAICFWKNTNFLGKGGVDVDISILILNVICNTAAALSQSFLE